MESYVMNNLAASINDALPIYSGWRHLSEILRKSDNQSVMKFNGYEIPAHNSQNQPLLENCVTFFFK